MRKSLGDYMKDFSWLEVRQKGTACEYRCGTCSVRGAKNKFSEWRVQKVGFQRSDDGSSESRGQEPCPARQRQAHAPDVGRGEGEGAATGWPRTTSSLVCGCRCRPLLTEMWSTHIGRNPRLAARSSSGQ